MEKFNNLFVPPVRHNYKELQQYYCKNSVKCTTNRFCSDCIYKERNIAQFKKWIKKPLTINLNE
jgi:hypothetical protein